VRAGKHIDFDDTIAITIVSHVSGIRIYISTGPDCRYGSIPNCFVSRLAGLINNLFGFYPTSVIDTSYDLLTLGITWSSLSFLLPLTYQDSKQQKLSTSSPTSKFPVTTFLTGNRDVGMVLASRWPKPAPYYIN
jgi:hypothetical protein